MDLIFQGKYFITGKLVCETGLHIGGTAEGFEIGGLDNPVIKDRLSDYPYIPGSALKGKLRHWLEWSLGENSFTNKPHHFIEEKASFQPCSCGRCEACVLFGTTPEPPKGYAEVKEQENLGFAGIHKIKEQKDGQEVETSYRITGPSRLTVRDSFPTTETIARLKQFLGENVYTELKTENALDRVTAEANPRTIERVPAGSEFFFEMIVDIYRDQDKKLINKLFEAMLLLENSALGGQGTRGHGKIKFADVRITYRSLDYYHCKAEQEEIRCECQRDNLDKPNKFKITGNATGEIAYKESLVKFLGSKMDVILK